MANFGKPFGDPAKKYALDIAIEQITDKPVASSYQNDFMSKGHELEPIAREMYQNEKFRTVLNGGFFCNDKIGCSPDGIVDDGLVEIKSSITPWAHFERIRKKDVDSAYKWQVIGTLLYTKKAWLDFVSYSPDFPEDRQLFVLRVNPDQYQKEFKMIEQRVSQFLELIESTKETILNSNYFL